MVKIENINETLEKTILRKELTDIIEKGIVTVVKCNKAHTAGEDPIIHETGAVGEQVPLRHLFDKGYDDDGNHLGYITDITYPNSDGVSIDFVNGTATYNGQEYRVHFDRNYNRNGSEKNEEFNPTYFFKEQWVNATPLERQTLFRMANAMGSPSLSRAIEEIVKSGVDLNRWSTKEKYVGTPLENMVLDQVAFDSLLRDMSIDNKANFMCSEQRQRRGFDMLHKYVSNPLPTTASVGRVSDKTINVHDKVTGDVRSLTGHNNNITNTVTTFKLIPMDSGTNGAYLGYAQNVKQGLTNDRYGGNILDEIAFRGGQKWERVVIDPVNNFVVEIPVNE